VSAKVVLKRARSLREVIFFGRPLLELLLKVVESALVCRIRKEEIVERGWPVFKLI
jgi:hypothetical protein